MFKTLTHWLSSLLLIAMLCFGSIHYQWDPIQQDAQSIYSGKIALQLDLPQPVVHSLFPNQDQHLAQETSGSIKLHEAALRTAQNILKPILHELLSYGAQSLNVNSTQTASPT